MPRMATTKMIHSSGELFFRCTSMFAIIMIIDYKECSKIYATINDEVAVEIFFMQMKNYAPGFITAFIFCCVL
jgi:hypothetical protein